MDLHYTHYPLDTCPDNMYLPVVYIMFMAMAVRMREPYVYTRNLNVRNSFWACFYFRLRGLHFSGIH